MALLLLLIDGQMEIHIDGQTTIKRVNIRFTYIYSYFLKLIIENNMNKKAKPLRKTDSRTDSSVKIQKISNLFTLGQKKLYMGPLDKNPKKKNQNFDF